MAQCSDARETGHCANAQESKSILKIFLPSESASRALTQKESSAAILLRKPG
jgi:hypothetical protein